MYTHIARMHIPIEKSSHRFSPIVQASRTLSHFASIPGPLLRLQKCSYSNKPALCQLNPFLSLVVPEVFEIVTTVSPSFFVSVSCSSCLFRMASAAPALCHLNPFLSFVVPEVLETSTTVSPSFFVSVFCSSCLFVKVSPGDGSKPRTTSRGSMARATFVWGDGQYFASEVFMSKGNRLACVCVTGKASIATLKRARAKVEERCIFAGKERGVNE